MSNTRISIGGYSFWTPNTTNYAHCFYSILYMIWRMLGIYDSYKVCVDNRDRRYHDLSENKFCDVCVRGLFIPCKFHEWSSERVRVPTEPSSDASLASYHHLSPLFPFLSTSSYRNSAYSQNPVLGSGIYLQVITETFSESLIRIRVPIPSRGFWTGMFLFWFCRCKFQNFASSSLTN